MSMILDAMRRSKEGETRGSDVPTVDTVHFMPEPEPRFSRWQVFVLIAVLVALVGTSARLLSLFEGGSRAGSGAATHSTLTHPSPDARFLDGASAESLSQRPGAVQKAVDTARPSVDQSPSTARESVAAAQVDRSLQSTNPTLGAKPESGGQPLNAHPLGNAPVAPEPPRPNSLDASVTSVSATTPRKSGPKPEELESIYRAMQEEASDATPSESGGKSASTVEPQSGEGVLPSAQSESPPIDFADILAAAQNEFGVTPLVESTEPLLETLSQQVKDEIPSLIYSEHNYDPSGDSFVILNGKSLRERQRAGAFTVIDILPDSVVLRWRETQFRVRARNSWINM
jgi:hypothetical protein